MKPFTSILILLFSSLTPVCGQHPETHTKSPQESVMLVPGIGSHHHSVSTTNTEAQKFFDQGLSFVYAFNHDEAIRSFKRAAELDPLTNHRPGFYPCVSFRAPR